MIDGTYDCKPTLTDQQVIDFCGNGFLVLEAVVPDEVNRRTLGFLDKHPSLEPVEILDEDWFVEGVIKNPRAAGAVRSLLGKDLKLPKIMSNHRVECPRPLIGGWHRDGGAIDSGSLDVLQVFYYPQDTPKEMGPTELVPSSHLLRIKRRFMTHYGTIRQGVRTAAPAGSIFITHYSIWHRATTATAGGIRTLLKYQYWRTSAPERDWVVDPDLDFMQVKFRPDVQMAEKWYDSIHVARLFLWLCGLGACFEFKGGPCWPITAGGGYHSTEGLPPGLDRRHDAVRT